MVDANLGFLAFCRQPAGVAAANHLLSGRTLELLADFLKILLAHFVYLLLQLKLSFLGAAAESLAVLEVVLLDSHLG